MASYFERVDSFTFKATEHTGGAWNPKDQHIAPALGLLAHVVETDRDARRDDKLPIGRFSYDILGTVPVDAVEVNVQVLRPGRTIELVEARLAHGGRDIVILRAWLMKPHDTKDLEFTPHRRIKPIEEMPTWEPTTTWEGGFISTPEGRRDLVEPGNASYWVRTPVELIEGEKVSAVARAAGLFDIANGMAPRVDPTKVAFPNIDLTAHLFTEPVGEWLGFDTNVSFGPSGIGLTHSILHDERGPIGAVSQCLTVRPH